MISKLVDSFNSMSTWTFMNIKGQGHSLTFVQGHSDSTFSNFFAQKALGRLKPTFIWSLYVMWGMKMCSNVPGHMTMPIHGEKLKKISFSEPRGWWPWNLVYSIGYSSTTNVFIWWSWVDLDHFYDRVKFVSECFFMGESLYSIECSCISKFVLIQHILSTQVSDTGPVVLWFDIFMMT